MNTRVAVRPNFLEFVLIHVLHARRSHDRDPRCRQRHNKIRARRIIIVGRIRAAESIAHQHQKTRRAQIDNRIQHRATCLHDAPVLLFSTRQKPSRIFKEYHGDVVQITKANKTGIFIRSIDVDLPGGDGRIIGDEPHHIAAHAAQCCDRIARSIRLRFQEVAVIAQLLNHDADIKGRIESCRRVKRLF